MRIRETSAELPVFDDDAQLKRVSALGAGSGPMSGFEFSEASVRMLTVKDVSLTSGKIRSVRAERASLSGVDASSVEISGCELGPLRWAAGRLSRVRFSDCKLLGARFDQVSLDHVVFTGCKLDYAVFDGVRATGPVLFIGCSLREAEFTGCDLSSALLDGCELDLASFGPGTYQNCDLRGNDLSAVTGVHHLKRAIIDRAQVMQLAEALAAELQISYGDDPPG